MNTALLIAGLLLLSVSVVDFVFTTLSCNGSGVLSTSLNRGLGKVLRPRSDGMRTWSGVLHLLAALVFWVSLMLLGGYLILLSGPDLVVNATTRVPADLSERAYYTAFVFSTLGIGDYAPGSDPGQHFTAVYSLLGFGVLTTAISYILSVTSAANMKKNLATFISSMGDTPTDLFGYFTTQPDGSQFSGRIDNLVSLLNTHVNNHLSYPIVHYFHSDRREWSAVIQLASLYECLLALRVHYGDRPEIQAHLRRLERSLEYFLQLAYLPQRLQKREESVLTQQRLEWRSRVLRGGGGSAVSINDNSRALGALLREAGYDWSDVFGAR